MHSEVARAENKNSSDLSRLTASSAPLAFARAVRRCDQQIVEPGLALSKKIRELAPDPRWAPMSPRALAVGGFVRDALLQRDPKDLDIEVYGVAPEILLATVRRMFPGQVNTVGSAFEVIKINLGEGRELDVSIPRRKSKPDPDQEGFMIKGDPTLSILEAARRRDFTINSLAADLLNGEFFDYFDGLTDLKAGKLRVTDAERFQDDPLRVYRGVQFASRFEFEIDKHTRLLLSEMVERGVLNELPRERVTEELRKALVKSKRPSIAFEQMRELGILQRYFPELHALIGVPQDPEWHPEGDVWIHTMMVLDQAARRFEGSPHKLCGTLAGLTHDLGKATTTKFEESRWRARGHEEAGEIPARAFFSRLAFSTEIVEQVIPCVTSHMTPVSLVHEFQRSQLNLRQQINAARRLVKRVHPADWDLFIGVCEADQRGRGFPDAQTRVFRSGEYLTNLVNSHGLQEVARQPLLQGRDLIELGLKPGPHFGAIISRIEELRDEGVIEKRSEALELVRRTQENANGSPIATAIGN